MKKKIQTRYWFFGWIFISFLDLDFFSLLMILTLIFCRAYSNMAIDKSREAITWSLYVLVASGEFGFWEDIFPFGVRRVCLKGLEQNQIRFIIIKFVWNYEYSIRTNNQIPVFRHLLATNPEKIKSSITIHVNISNVTSQSVILLK